MQFSADISLDDHREFINFLELASDEELAEDGPDQSAFERVVYLVLLVFAAGALGYLVFSKGLDGWIQRPVMTTAFVMLFLCICLFLTAHVEARGIDWPQDWDRIDHSAVRDGFNLGEVRFDVQPEGLHVTCALVRNLYAWNGFHSFSEGPDAFYLMFTECGDGVIVPKRAFADEAARESFKEFAASHIGAH